MTVVHDNGKEEIWRDCLAQATVASIVQERLSFEELSTVPAEARKAHDDEWSLEDLIALLDSDGNELALTTELSAHLRELSLRK